MNTLFPLPALLHRPDVQALALTGMLLLTGTIGVAAMTLDAVAPVPSVVVQP